MVFTASTDGVQSSSVKFGIMIIMKRMRLFLLWAGAGPQWPVHPVRRTRSSQIDTADQDVAKALSPQSSATERVVPVGEAGSGVRHGDAVPERLQAPQV